MFSFFTCHVRWRMAKRMEHQTKGVGMSTDLQGYITRQPQLGVEASLPYCLHPQPPQTLTPKSKPYIYELPL